jgi:hypothetical protein
MSIVDDLVATLVERNAIKVNGTLQIRLTDGGLKIEGTLASSLQDQKKGRDVVHANVPINATVRVGEIVVPVPKIP